MLERVGRAGGVDDREVKVLLIPHPTETRKRGATYTHSSSLVSNNPS